MVSKRIPPEHAVEQAMVAIRRRQTRRALAVRASAEHDPPVSPAVTELLDSVEAQTLAGHHTTITGLTSLLGVDQPRVSKLASAAVTAGLLVRVADQADGRRSTLQLSADGVAYLDAVHRYRRDQFARAMHSWTDRQRATFATLLTRFVTALDAPDERC